MEKIHVLLVEDERTLSMIIKDTLEEQGFRISTAFHGEEGLRMFFAERPEVVVADVMMPRMDGFEMVRHIRQTDRTTPVLFLTARSGINDVVEGFELGANDYLKKPFSMQELIIRIKALLHKAFVQKEQTHIFELGANDYLKKPFSMQELIIRIKALFHKAFVQKEQTHIFELGNYLFHAVSQQLTYAGISQELSHRESEILRRLCEHRNEVVSTQSILLELWGDDSFFNSRSLHVFITKLRHKLAKDERIRIVNVRGIGYKLLFNEV